MQEERDEAREQRLVERDESYYKKMDELLRKKTRMRKESEDMGTKKNVEQKKSVTEYESAKKATSLWKRKKIEKALP